MTKPNFKPEHKLKVRCGICNIDIPNWRGHVMSEKHRKEAAQIIPEIESSLKRFNQLEEETT